MKIAQIVVIVERPVSVRSETARAMRGYTIVTSFMYSGETTCRILGGDVLIEPEDALEGARYGWYECRVVGEIGARYVSEYSKDSSMVRLAIGLASLAAILGLAFGD